MNPAQWDIVRVRINPEDRDEHPAIVFSPDEHCADVSRLKLNVLYGISAVRTSRLESMRRS